MAIGRAIKSVAKAILPKNTIEYLKRMRLVLGGETWPLCLSITCTHG